MEKKAGTVLAPFMNEFFRNKVEKLKQKVSPSLSRSLYYTSKYREKVCGLAQEEFSFKGTDLDTIRKHISSLSNTTSVGVDDIPTFIVKKMTRSLAPVILHLVNQAITQSTYPGNHIPYS